MIQKIEDLTYDKPRNQYEADIKSLIKSTKGHKAHKELTDIIKKSWLYKSRLTIINLILSDSLHLHKDMMDDNERDGIEKYRQDLDRFIQSNVTPRVKYEDVLDKLKSENVVSVNRKINRFLLNEKLNNFGIH